MPHEAFDQLLDHLGQAFVSEPVLVASPDAAADAPHTVSERLHVVGYPALSRSRVEWTNTAADYLNGYELLQAHPARALLQLGVGAETIPPAALRDLAQAVLSGGNDLVLAHYAVPPRAGLVNSAILYPLSRALFGQRARFPLALDLCLSPRMSERLATAAQRFTAANQPDALLWPVDEAALASLIVNDVPVPGRVLPQPTGMDLNSLLAQVTGSLFADLDLKAALWQRARIAQPQRSPSAGSHPVSSPSLQVAPDELQPMLDSFRLAYTNLREIWSLVLPPQSLFGLKRLAETSAASFRMPDALWARTIFDFLLAFRLRTLNRGHLLGALTPLYLAWVASHLLLISSGADAERHVEEQAAAFEADKPYLVSRWRWPDRFNP
jgi:hypothetical protein